MKHFAGPQNVSDILLSRKIQIIQTLKRRQNYANTAIFRIQIYFPYVDRDPCTVPVPYTLWLFTTGIELIKQMRKFCF
jgi:hypothetical protein